MKKKSKIHTPTISELKEIIGQKKWILNDLLEHCNYCERCKEDEVLTVEESKSWAVAGNRAKVIRVEIENLQRQMPVKRPERRLI